MSDDNESSEDHVDDSCSSEDDSLNPDDRSVISVDIDDDDYEDLTKSALNSLLQPIEFDSLSPTSKIVQAVSVGNVVLMRGVRTIHAMSVKTR